MAIVQCPNNHYYDDKKNTQCPYCEKLNARECEDDLNEQLTSYFEPEENDDNVQLTEGYGEVVYEYEKTIGIFTDETNNVLTTGWLVCISGAEKGKSYTLHSGRNFVGRSLNMDVVLSDDVSISREKHFSIVYDPRSVRFYLVAGSGYTYKNEQLISMDNELFEGDIIRAGQNQYIFIPFCKEGREWE